MKRPSWSVLWVWVVSSSLCGCLFHSTVPTEDLPVKTEVSATARTGGAEVPTPLSNYRVHEQREAPSPVVGGQRVAGAAPTPQAGIEQAKMEMKPGPSIVPAPPPPPPEPPASTPPPPLPEITPAPAKPAGEASPTNPTSPTSPPETVEPPLVAALRKSLEKHPQEVAQLSQRYERPNRELLLALVRLTADIDEGDLARLPAKELSATLEQLHTLTATLRRKAPLTLERLCYCRGVAGFGVYDALPADHPFQAGIDDRPGERVKMYAEVRNFQSVPRNGGYETILSSSLEIRDQQQNKVAQLSLGKCVDRSRSPRQDYFLNCEFNVPPRLPAGSYTLVVTVKDITTGEEPGQARTATNSLAFIVAPGRTEASR